MTAKPLINHVDALIPWLKTYPALANGLGVDEMSGDVSLIEFDPFAGAGANMLQNVNAIYSPKLDDILGTVVVNCEVDFILYARRYLNDMFWRKEAADFMAHLCMWCAQEQILRPTGYPKFGDTNQEQITISGGMPWQTVEGNPMLTDFMWQLKIYYQLVYSETA